MIRRQVVMPVSPERLWDALTDPDEIAGWFGGRVEWELEEGGAARFRSNDGSERVGRVEAVRPGRHLRFRWWPAEGPDEAPDVSEVSYLLEPMEEGTRLTIQERQVAGAPEPGGAQACAAGSPAGWTEGSPAGWTVWDGRLVGAWAGLVAEPALEGVRVLPAGRGA